MLNTLIHSGYATLFAQPSNVSIQLVTKINLFCKSRIAHIFDEKAFLFVAISCLITKRGEKEGIGGFKNAPRILTI